MSMSRRNFLAVGLGAMTLPLVARLGLDDGAASAAVSGSRWLGVHVDASSGMDQRLDAFTELVGRKPRVQLTYGDFSQPFIWPAQVSMLKSRGITPMLSWAPNGNGATLLSIAQGKQNTYLSQCVTIAKNYVDPIICRFGYEMNGSWTGYNRATEFKNAWQYVVNYFRNRGVTNVSWCFAPNVLGGSTVQDFNPFYPGDSYVDRVGLDGYNWGQGSWQSFYSVFKRSYDRITALAPTKPLYITETASEEDSANSSRKATWIKDAYLNYIPNSMPKINGIVWFHRLKERRWPVDSSSASLAAYRAVVAEPAYQRTAL